MSPSQPRFKHGKKGLWLVAVLGLLWNAMGMINLLMQMNAGMLASMPAEQQAIVESRPAWATFAFAVGVLAGALGCLLLLWRMQRAFAMLTVSLAAIALHMMSYFGMPIAAFAFSSMQVLLYVALPLGIAVFLAWFAKASLT